MLSRATLLASLLPVLCHAQAADPVTNQRVLDELKGIRGSLERIEKSQRALLILVRVQIDESQAATLEAQRQRLSAEESGLNKEIAAASRAVSSPPPMMVNAEGQTEAAVRTDDGPMRARLSRATATLEEVVRNRQALEKEIARLRSRIAAIEKLVEDILR